MDKKEFLNSLQAQISDWQKELNDLGARADKAGARAKDELQAQIKELNAHLDEARGKLKQIQEVGPDAWEDVRAGFEKSWTEMRGAFRSALARFKR